jgi:agmatine/peptidylarginine deiminase
MSVPTPAAAGFVMPPEWAPHEATWLTWPKDPVTWPDRVPQVETIFLRMIEALAEHETVNLLVDDEVTEARVRARMTWPQAANVCLHRIRTVDSWIRDYGPNFIVRGRGGASLAYNDWIFYAWGGKYETLMADDAVGAALEPLLGIPRFAPGLVLEGGSIDVNGAGVVLTTEQCLLNTNRNPTRSKAEIEQALRDHLGVSQVLWLGEGVAGDDTDGHIDDISRFVSPTTIVTAVEEDRELLHRQRGRAAAGLWSRQRRARRRDSSASLPRSTPRPDQLRAAGLGHGRNSLRHPTAAEGGLSACGRRRTVTSYQVTSYQSEWRSRWVGGTDSAVCTRYLAT